MAKFDLDNQIGDGAPTNDSALSLKRKATIIPKKISNKRQRNVSIEPTSIDNPILISDNEDDDEDDIQSPYSIIVISDDDDDNTPSSSRNIKHHQALFIDDSGVEMNDNGFTVISQERSYVASGDFIRIGRMSDDSETHFQGKDNTNLQDHRNFSTEPIEVSDDEFMGSDDDDDDSNNEYMKANYPWWRSVKGQNASLQDQALDFVGYLQPRNHEVRLRHYLVHKIRFTLQETWQGAQVNVFGSFGTNTFLPNSDIDLTVSFPHESLKPSLYRISNVLKQAGVCHGTPSIIGSATVPVLKFVDALTRIKVDITLSSRNGVECTDYISNVLNGSPCARELILMAKHMVALRHLDVVYTGGIGGLSITCLAIRFLQEHTGHDQNLGALLLGFLHYYGVKFSLGKTRISISGNGSTSIKAGFYRGRHGEPLFSIEDPLSSYNDLGAKSYNALQIVKMFRDMYTAMDSRSSSNSRIGHTQPNLKPGSLVKSMCHPSCILSEIGFIPISIVNQRALMEEVYLGQKWKNELAAATFDWNMDS